MFYDAAKINDLKREFQLEKYSIVLLDEVDSTSNYAMDNIAKLANNTVILSEAQKLGRGRNGKVWTSRPGIDIMVSFIHEFPLEFEYGLLPLVIAIAVNRLFKQYRITTKIKWPNDILLVDKTKVAGILVEAKVRSCKRLIVTGVGIDNIDNWDRNVFLINLIRHVENILSEYQFFGFALFRREWLDNCIHHQQIISLYQGNQLLHRGIHTDITSSGKILVKDIQSEEIFEYSGSKISLLVEG